MFFGDGFSHDAFPRKPVDNETLYNMLGVSKSASTDEIKKAFKKLAIKHHPDKGGDQEKFKEVCKAYEVLSDPEKRATYDKFGEEGLESVGGGGGQATDIFDMFFGGGRRARGPRRGEDVVSELKWTLEQFYNGATRKMAITHDITCNKCSGHGGPIEALISCDDCNGTGIRVIVRSMGHMFTKSQSPCHTCHAQGKMMPESKKCKDCDGRGVLKEKKILEVVLARGAREGHKIVFRGEADQKPGEVAGDVVFVCSQIPHSTFKRSGMDLFMEKTISLYEALTSVAFYIDHLDGERRFVTCNNRVISEGMILAMQGEGMPKQNQIYSLGNIYIKFHLQMPTQPLSGDRAVVLETFLPRTTGSVAPPMADSEVSICKLTYIDPESTSGANSSSAHDEDDDEDMPGPAGVQCRQG